MARALILAGVLVLCGCAGLSSPVRSRGRAGSLAVSSTNAAAPAKASRLVDRSAITLPAGSRLEVGPVCQIGADGMTYTPAPGAAAAPGDRTGTVAGIVATLSAPAEWVREISRDTLETATAFAAPGAADLAKADGVRSYWRAGLVCFALAALSLWRRHWLAAAAFVLAGVALPALASFLSGGWAILVAAVLIGAAVAFVAGWHVLRRRGALAEM